MADPSGLFTDGLREGHKAELETFVSGLSERYPVVLKNDEDFEAIESALRDFEIVKPFRLLSLLNYLQVELGGASLDLFVAAVNFSAAAPADDGEIPGRTEIVLTDFRIIGYFQSKSDLGHALVRPHRKGDFIAALFKSEEVEFEGFDGFNRRYHVIADAPDALKRAFSAPVLEKFAAGGDLHFESLNGVVLAFQDRDLKAGEGLRLVELFDVMAREGI
jgi:hypothetical protein